ncbi:M23 family metallopeptidase, partial [Piscibacillus sp. B03]|uniref:M23 family metallopeptidase n=1 Tax=Piscibacillus sp. B03 TaxID=3457430 RepID=UPI003FCDB902
EYFVEDNIDFVADYSKLEATLFEYGYDQNDIEFVEVIYNQSVEQNQMQYSEWASTGSTGGTGGTTNPGLAPMPSVDDGEFTKPTIGVITSPYGYRIHPISGKPSFHRGIDIAPTDGSMPAVVAVADGTVRLVKWDAGGYGHWVVITHEFNGQIYESQYAHLHSHNVSVGQKVKKGEQIGIMGTTGGSTGVHLHFEMHLGHWNGDASSFNPLANDQGIEFVITQ